MNELKQLKKKVEYCLEKYPASRNSDKYLFNALLITFYKNEIIDISRDEKPVYAIKLENIYEVPSFENMARVRRKIQNPDPKRNYAGKFPPTNPEVLKKRGWMEEDMRKFLGYHPELRNIY